MTDAEEDENARTDIVSDGDDNERVRERGEDDDEDEEVGSEDDGSDEDDDDDDDDDDSENPLAHLPGYVLKRVEKLKALNDERDKIMDKYLAERAALEQKYAAMVKPVYDERLAVVRGDKDEEIEIENQTSSADQTSNGGATSPRFSDSAETATSASEDASAPKVSGIPQFWICSMTQMETIGELITEEDIDCLEHLENISCTDDEDGKGFTLRFHFAPNEYFHDEVLTKRYEVPNLLLSDEPILKNVVGCSIQWKPDRSLTFRKIKKKQRGKGKNAGQIRTVTKTEEKESFFRWFSPPKMPTSEVMDEEEAEHLEEVFDSDYDVAQAFRLQIVPKAVLWFTGEAAEKELLEAMQSDDDFEGL